VSRPVVEAVEEAIKQATEILTGKKPTGVENTPITLIVQKAGLPDLTLVDLPGITRVALEGQPEDIEERINDMINGLHRET